MYPEDLRYTVEHEWVRRLGAEVMQFGITSFAVSALGDVVFVAPPEVGQDVVAGEPCGEVESTKSVSDIYAPVSGQVSAVNTALADEPELVNAEPYGQGWLADVRCASPDDADAAWDALLSAADYQARLA